MNKIIEDMAKATSQVLELFLHEYCEVNGTKEENLKENLVIEYAQDGSLCVKEKGIVLLRQSFAVKDEQEKPLVKTLVNTFCLSDKVRFPKTAIYLQENGTQKTAAIQKEGQS